MFDKSIQTISNNHLTFFSGTDATHAEHIETIQSRSYVGLEDQKYFVPGELGMGLVDGKFVGPV